MKKIEKTVLLPSLVVFLAVMAVVGISFLMSRNSVQEEVGTYIHEYSERTEGSIEDELKVYEETLRAGLGLFAVEGSVSKDDFTNFVKTTSVLTRYSSAQSIIYAKVVEPANLADFTANAKTTISSEYTVTPEGVRDRYIPIMYIEPQSDQNSRGLGFDIYSEPTRAKALNAARDSGEVRITDTVQSIVDKSPAGRAFLMYAPQYKQGANIATLEQRRASIEGFLYTAFRINKFIDSTNINVSDKNIAFAITVGESKSELFKTSNFNSLVASNSKQYKSDLPIAGNVFQFTYAYRDAHILPFASSRPLAILVFGTLTALLLATAVWLVLRGKANELLLEQERGINEAKDNLLSLASHQLRTPATGVKQYLGMLLQGFSGRLTKQQHQLLEKAYAGNERQLKTINDVLYLARLGSGRIVLSKSNFMISQVITDIVSELQIEVAARNHKLVVKLPKAKKRFYGDAHMIRMAIENLITNAIKYTHDSGTITIKLTVGKQARITVQDNGVGIDKSQQDRLFKQFERIDNDLSITVGGSGIGLYVVNNIVALHGGYMEVSSKINEGSRFTIVLPSESINK